MSHIAEVNLELKDLDALAKAADALGMELVRDCKTFNYYAGQSAPCIHKLRLKDAPAGAYEIGLRYADGSGTTLQPFWDTFGHHGQNLVRAGGAELVGLKQRYAAEVSAKELRRKAYRVEIKTEGNQLRVLARK